ncbi:MAG TPA: SDR family NAD(P)-dependent oxidoreductase [Roseiarcus sp.]|nr:SDR family NAD(P)-dependent oxidoreductase [Roseiarcus sp.]
MDLELAGKVAIVTGASRGIGKAVAAALAREGADAALVARDRIALDAAAAQIAAATGSRVKPFAADTGDDDAVKAMVAAVLAAFGRVDILVNCAAQPAGQSKPPSLAEITTEALWAEVNVKVMGYLRTAREVAKPMAEQGWGRIVNISGLAARTTGSIIGTIRNISVAALTKNLADELAPKGISAVCVHPGTTRTEKTPGVVERRAQALGLSLAEVEARMAAANLAGRLITAEEIGDIVAFLASPKSVAINGDAIAAGGGVAGAIYY